MLAGVLYLTEGQQIYLAGFNFFAIRFLEVAGFARIFFKGELRRTRFNSIDKTFLLFQSVYLLVFLVRYLQTDSTGSLAFRAGFFCDGSLSYLIFRALLADLTIFRNFLRNCVFLIVPFTIFMVVESATGHNIFHFMGSVPAESWYRNGHFRAQGSFRDPIMAGSFGATLFPLFAASVLAHGRRLWNIMGAAACLTITITAHSGGPLFAFLAGIGALYFWRFREYMKLVRWGMFFSVVLLQLMMKAPVWFIIDRVSGIVGGHGWDRANLINQFAKHFNEWWLIGMSSVKTVGWAATQIGNSTDVVNTYAAVGIGGGLISLVLFILIILKCFQALGNSIRSIHTENGASSGDQFFLWGIGCSLFSHITNIVGVTYFDQMYVVWYMTLAAVASLAVERAYESMLRQTDEFSVQL